MKQRSNRLFGATLALFLTLAVGCASGGGSEAADPGEPGVTRITVENFHPNSEDLRVYMEPDGGVGRIDLGVVPRGETTEFNYDGERGQFRLVAERPVGTLRSNRINVNHNTHLTWTIQQNRIVTSRR
jgi:hypothetical protein